MHGGTQGLLVDGVVLLGFALVFVLLFRRLGLVGGAEAKMGFAELGITLLLFIVGLELSPSRLWSLKRDIFGFGLAQVTLAGLAIAAVIWGPVHFSAAAALALGLPLALSSTAQVLPMLQSAGRLRTPFGERAFSILLFQDLSIVPLITIVAALSRAPADPHAPPGWLLALETVGAIAGLVIAGRFLMRPLFRLIGVLGEREMFVFAGLFTVIASAAVMQALGLSTALGAFIAGVMLADSPYRHELEADVEPFRSILLGLFFLAIGMMLDLHAIAERPFFVIGVALALIATKTAVIGLLALAFGMGWRGALALGLLLSQGGEFGFVLFAQAQKSMLIAPEAASLFGAVVTLSMATTPFLMAATRRFRAEPAPPTDGLERPRRDGAAALVVGYGRFGQTAAQMMIAQGIAVTLIDRDPGMIEIAGTFGAKVYFGDGTRLDLLRQAGAGEAQAILFCIDGDQIEADLLKGVNAAFPDALIYVRAFDRRSLMKMDGARIAASVREVFESALCLAREAMTGLGIDDGEITRAEHEYRRRDRERLQLQTETGDLKAGRDTIITEAVASVSAAPVPGGGECG